MNWHTRARLPMKKRVRACQHASHDSDKRALPISLVIFFYWVVLWRLVACMCRKTAQSSQQTEGRRHPSPTSAKTKPGAGGANNRGGGGDSKGHTERERKHGSTAKVRAQEHQQIKGLQDQQWEIDRYRFVYKRKQETNSKDTCVQ